MERRVDRALFYYLGQWETFFDKLKSVVPLSVQILKKCRSKLQSEKGWF